MLKEDFDLLKRIMSEKLKRKSIEAIGNRNKEPNLKAVSDALDEFYFLDKLRTYCAYLSYSKIINSQNLTYQKSDFQLIDAIIEQIEKRQFSNELLTIYNNIRKIYESIEAPSKEAKEIYANIFHDLKENVDYFSVEEAEELYSFLSNYSIRQMNNGIKKHRENYFLVTNELHNLKYGKRGKKRSKLPGSVFKNTVVVAVYLKESSLFQSLETVGLNPMDAEKGFANAFEWLEAYIPYYGARLSQKDQKIYLPYCLAILEFEQQKFVKAYRTLKNPIGVRGMFINMNIKMLYLKILYEVNSYKPIVLEIDGIEIEKVLESFRGLVRDEINRKKELAYQIEFYANFEKHYRQILRLYNKYDGQLYNDRDQNFLQQKLNLEKEIRSIKYPSKGWLLKKLAEIK